MSIWRRSTLRGDKHLLLDVNVIVDTWLGLGSEEITEKILDLSRADQVKLWLSASSIPTIEYVAKRSFKQRGVPPDEVQTLVSGLMTDLFQCVDILTNYGFDQKGIYSSAKDFEDAQIAASIRSLHGASVCIVSEDEEFDALGEVPVFNPAQALAWITSSDTAKGSIPFIDLAAQQHRILPNIEKNIATVLRHGQYIMGPEIKQLEEKLATYTGAQHCITVASGTEALLISLMALGIGPGVEVITPPFTFVATAEVIVLLGATPVFVDVEPDTCNIDPSKIKAAITDKTKAIIPVSLYGQPADMDEINAVAAKHGLPVIEDACQSFGATYKGRKSCNVSTVGCTSFFPSKPLGCYGDGGAIFTSDDALAQACREIRVHGQSKRYVHTRIGVGGRFDTIQAAVLLAKLEQFEWEIKQRIKIGAQYNQLMDQHGIQRVQQRPDRTGVFAQYTVLVDNRDELQKRLTEGVSSSSFTLPPSPLSIPTAVHYPIPLNEQPAYKTLCKGAETPVAAALAQRVISLPMHAYLATDQQIAISTTVAGAGVIK
uniref:aminotransferase class I/II-fold pyridoxal phosphate-dependent enzyme n=1 Tax=Trichlorobacter lovleyi TaxID=313985 RepID=UPI00129466AC